MSLGVLGVSVFCGIYQCVMMHVVVCWYLIVTSLINCVCQCLCAVVLVSWYVIVNTSV